MAGVSVVSELLMSVNAPRADARISNTPATTTGHRHCPKCKVNARVVVEWKHLHYRLKPQKPERAVLVQHNHQKCNFYGHAKSKAKHDTWRFVLNLFLADQGPLDVAWSHVKKVLRSNN